MSTMPHHKDLLSLLNKTLTVGDGHRTQPMIVLQVSTVSLTAQYECFSMTLRGSTHQALPQGVYRVELEGIGDSLLLMVPVAADAEAIDYQIVFSRPHADG
jgi:hypothetical protein